MQLMTKQAVKQLQTDLNRVLVVEDYDLIEKLDKAACEVTKVSKRESRLLRQPFDLCGVKFYPLTVAKSIWFAEKCDEWELTDTEQEAFLIWLLTVDNTDTALDSYTERKAAGKAVRRVSRRLHCTQREMTEVYYKCLGRSANKDTEGGCDDVDYGGMIAVLIREYGNTPEYWLYETPVEMIGVLFRAHEEKIMRENEAQESTAAKSGKAVAPRPSARLKALAEFRRVSNEIREAWSKDDGE